MHPQARPSRDSLLELCRANGLNRLEILEAAEIATTCCRRQGDRAHQGGGCQLSSMVGVIVTFVGAGLMFLAVIASKLNKINRQLAEADQLLSKDDDGYG